MEPTNPVNQPTQPPAPPTEPAPQENPVPSTGPTAQTPPAPASSEPSAQPAATAESAGSNPADPGYVSPSTAIYGAPMQSTTPTAPSLPAEPQGPQGRKFGIPKLGMVGMLIVLLIVVLGAGAAAYFGYYAPNQPDNMWAKSLSNMGKGYDKIASYADTYPTSKGSTISGNFQLTGDEVADGTISGASDGGNSSLDLSLSTHGIKSTLDVLSIKSNTSNPDIYIKVGGLDGLSELFGGQYADLGSLFKDVNGQWYFIDHSLLDQLDSGSSGSSSTPTISKADVKEVVNAVGGPTKKYVFTGDTKNMAFVIKQKIGKEKIDGRSTYHYKIGVDKTNLKAYDKAVCQNLSTTKLFKLLTSDDKSAADSCSDTSDIDKIKDSSTADVWVDTHTKLIHKVRFSDPQDKTAFTDLNQDYQGGDTLPLGVDFGGTDSGSFMSGGLNMTLNTTTHAITMDGNIKSTGKSNFNGVLKLNMTPSSSPVNITKPANSKNIMQLLDDLGLGGLIGSGGSGGGQMLPLQ